MDNKNTNDKIVNITKAMVPSKESLESRLRSLEYAWYLLPKESLESVSEARKALDQMALAEGYFHILVAESYFFV